MKNNLLLFCVLLLILCLSTLLFVGSQHPTVFTFSRRFAPITSQMDDLTARSQSVFGKSCYDNSNIFDGKLANLQQKSVIFALKHKKFSAQKGANSFVTSASSCVVMERDSGRILFEKDGCKHLPMASTTKIVTALTVIENANLDDVVTIPAQACGIEGSSIYLREGEILTVKELLYGLMLRSGNDCAVALALHVSGSLQKFAEMMNQTAQSLGCFDSNFVNPHGLHDENHYTSARDLATITCCALQNEDFAQIVCTKTVKIANDGYDYPRVLTNKNKLLTNFDDADGVKTGYTKKAGRCFVGSATRNGMQIVAVVLNCGPMFEETAKLLDVAFSNYQKVCVVPQNKLCGVLYQNGKPTYYYCDEQVCYPMTSNEKLSRNIILDDKTHVVQLLLDGRVFKTIELTAMQ